MISLAESPTVVTTDDGICTLTLNTPDNLNAMNRHIAGRLRCIVEQAPAQGVRCIVLTGAGRAFCSGQDLRSDDSEIGTAVLLEEHYNPLVEALVNCPVPTVAALNGVTAGIGASFALACDIRVAAESASLAFLFSRIGLAADGGASYFLPRLMPTGLAMELMLLGDKIPAHRAEALGLVSRVFPDEGFADGVQEIAQRLADGPIGALGFIKRQLRGSLERTLEEQLAHETALQAAAATGAEYREGKAAFLAKRPADYRSA